MLGRVCRIGYTIILVVDIVVNESDRTLENRKAVEVEPITTT
jgi:hypothetical protein